MKIPIFEIILTFDNGQQFYRMNDFTLPATELLSWNCISAHQKLSEQFIEEHKELVDWYYISIYQSRGLGSRSRRK